MVGRDPTSISQACLGCTNRVAAAAFAIARSRAGNEVTLGCTDWRCKPFTCCFGVGQKQTGITMQRCCENELVIVLECRNAVAAWVGWFQLARSTNHEDSFGTECEVFHVVFNVPVVHPEKGRP